MRRVRRYDFVGGSVSLGVGFEVVKTQAWPSPSPPPPKFIFVLVFHPSNNTPYEDY